jgi:hypothetical protein
MNGCFLNHSINHLQCAFLLYYAKNNVFLGLAMGLPREISGWTLKNGILPVQSTVNMHCNQRQNKYRLAGGLL